MSEVGVRCEAVGASAYADEYQIQFDDGVTVTTWECESLTAPWLIVNQGGLTLDEFNTLWPLLCGLLVTGYLAKMLIRQVNP